MCMVRVRPCLSVFVRGAGAPSQEFNASMNNAYETLREYIFGLQIVDTHEHMHAREESRDKTADVLSEYLTHYFSCDLVSAGLKPDELAVAHDVKRPLMERWKLVEPYWDAARLTGYGRALDIAARDIYGFTRIDATRIQPLNDAFRAALASGGHYQRVLKDLGKIRVSIHDNDLACDRRFFRSVVRVEDFIMLNTREQVLSIQRRTGVRVHSLDDLKAACTRFMDDAFAKGAVAIKTALAYLRPLHYPKVAAADAERELADILNNGLSFPATQDVGLNQTRSLQAHMMHHVLAFADARGLAVQFHTGLQEGNGNVIANANPALLSNLFHEYENVKFDIFHIGYPYEHVLSALAKNFRNVFIDFAWAHIISPQAARDALIEYLDAVPANKISAFGGDFAFPDGAYGHQFIARENVARALAAKVELGICGIDDAKHLAVMLLHDNPIAILNLKEQDLP